MLCQLLSRVWLFMTPWNIACQPPLSKRFSRKEYWLLLLSCFSRVQLCATWETATHQAPLSMGFSRQEYWSGLPLPSPRNTGVGCLSLLQRIFPTQGLNTSLLHLLHWQADFFTTELFGKPFPYYTAVHLSHVISSIAEKYCQFLPTYDILFRSPFCYE